MAKFLDHSQKMLSSNVTFNRWSQCFSKRKLGSNIILYATNIDNDSILGKNMDSAKLDK